MTYLIIFVVLIFTILIYFKAADRYNIVDEPNHRSSHFKRTIRGGGIIFPVAVIIWFALMNFKYPFVFMGFIIISIISFFDDIYNLKQYQRLIGQMISVYFLLLQVNGFILPIWMWFLGFLFILGWINTFNFMDGINGITMFHTSIILASFYWLPNLLEFQQLIKLLGLAILIFGFFNVRINAITFLGDVGSITIAFILGFLMLVLIVETHRWEYIIFFSVYGIDSVLTICQRIFFQENIFLTYRKHLYQYLVNEKQWSHLVVSVIYAVLQAIINLVLILFIIPHPHSTIFSISLLTLLGFIYLILKYEVVYSLQKPTIS